MNTNSEPLVSIVIITYNSAAHIVATLDGAKNQTYQNLELIISDDSSTDNTLEICRSWIETNGARFKRCEIISVSQNSGVPSNCNRGISAAQGEWLKLCAGDDILHENCIDLLMHDSENKNVITGKYRCFQAHFAASELDVLPTAENLNFFNLSAEQQHRELLLNPFNFTPGIIIRKSVFQKYGLYSENYRLLEDLPYWVHLTSNGEKIYFVDEIVIYYRVSSDSISMSSERIFNVNFMEDLFAFKKKEVYTKVPKSNILFYQEQLWDRLHFRIMVNVFRNRPSKYSSFVSYLFSATKLKVWSNKLKKILS